MPGRSRRPCRSCSLIKAPPSTAPRSTCPSAHAISTSASVRLSSRMRIGILTGGGDVPGLNPCIRSIALSADALGWQVTGFRRGWEGVLAIDPPDPASIAANSLPLTREGVRGIDRMGGTILHTSRSDPRTLQSGDQTERVLQVLEGLGIDAMITLGGDGTLRFSAHLAGRGLPVVSIPKTM